jgi:hypothetical protein
MKKLALVALIGLTSSAAFIGAAAALDARSFADSVDFPIFGGRHSCQLVPGATATSRELDWDGSDHVILSVGGHATYTPGTDNKVHLGGDPQTLAHIEVADGHIQFDCGGWHHDNGNLSIILPGRTFQKFGIAGHGNLALQKLDQAALKVSIAGSGSIKADGKVEQADLNIAGSGDMDMTRLASRVTTVHIDGSGSTDIAPSEEANIHINGSGDVNLHTNPKQLETHINGSGRIRHLTAGG